MAHPTPGYSVPAVWNSCAASLMPTGTGMGRAYPSASRSTTPPKWSSPISAIAPGTYSSAPPPTPSQPSNCGSDAWAGCTSWPPGCSLRLWAAMARLQVSVLLGCCRWPLAQRLKVGSAEARPGTHFNLLKGMRSPYPAVSAPWVVPHPPAAAGGCGVDAYQALSRRAHKLLQHCPCAGVHHAPGVALKRVHCPPVGRGGVWGYVDGVEAAEARQGQDAEAGRTSLRAGCWRRTLRLQCS